MCTQLVAQLGQSSAASIARTLLGGRAAMRRAAADTAERQPVAHLLSRVYESDEQFGVRGVCVEPSF